MKKMLFFVIMMILAASCSSSSSKNDADQIAAADEDTVVNDVKTDSNEGTVTDTANEGTAGDEDSLVPDTDGGCPVSTPAHHDNETIAADTKWTGTHIVNGALTINKKLELDKCAVVQLEANSHIVVRDGGSIKSIGTADSHAVFTSMKATPAKGDWKYIEFKDTASAENEFAYTTFAYGGQDSYGVLFFADKTSVKIDNCLFKETKDRAITFDGKITLGSFTGNSFEKNESYLIVTNADMIASLAPVTSDKSGKDRVFIDGGTVTTAGTWKNLGVNYEVNTLYINKPVVVEAGTTFMMNPNTSISLRDGGSLKAVGTADKKITFTSQKEGPAKGDWRYIEIKQTASSDSEFAYVKFEYAGQDSYGAVYVEDGANVKIDNCLFANILDNAVMFASGAKLNSFTGNSFEKNDAVLIDIADADVKKLSPFTTDTNSEYNIAVHGTGDPVNGTWKKLGAPFNIYSNIYITASTLTVEAGVIIMMQPNGNISVRDSGALKLTGSSTDKVTITSAKAGPAAGDWDYIEIKQTSSNANNVFTYADIKYGGNGGYGQLYVESGATVKLDHVTFSNGETCDVMNDNGGATITNTSSTYQLCP